MVGTVDRTVETMVCQFRLQTVSWVFLCYLFRYHCQILSADWSGDTTDNRFQDWISLLHMEDGSPLPQQWSKHGHWNVDKEQKGPKCWRNNRMENGMAVQILLEHERVKVVAFWLSLDSLNAIQLKCSVNQQIKQMFYAGHWRRLACVQVSFFKLLRL